MTAWPWGVLIGFLAGVAPFLVCLVIAGVRKKVRPWKLAGLFVVFSLGFAPYVFISSIIGQYDYFYYFLPWIILYIFRKSNRILFTTVAVLCGIGLAVPPSKYLHIGKDTVFFYYSPYIFENTYAKLGTIFYFATLMLIASYLMQPTRKAA